LVVVQEYGVLARVVGAMDERQSVNHNHGCYRYSARQNSGAAQEVLTMLVPAMTVGRKVRTRSAVEMRAVEIEAEGKAEPAVARRQPESSTSPTTLANIDAEPKVVGNVDSRKDVAPHARVVVESKRRDKGGKEALYVATAQGAWRVSKMSAHEGAAATIAPQDEMVPVPVRMVL
jgi:hypothetical protein